MPSRNKTSQNASADVFSAIAHPVRRQILSHLGGKTLTATQITEQFVVSQSAVSQHLKILLETGLVSRQRDGREQYYRIQPEVLAEVADWVKQFEVLWFESMGKLDSVLDRIAQDETAEKGEDQQ